MKSYQHLFGPVPSRRLGLSLGVDLLPFKTCSFDCIFCQLGRTTDKTLMRKPYAPVDAVVGELRHWLNAGGRADYITLSGSGEPTLHTQFGDVIDFARGNTRIPIALLTNGSLLADAAVRAAAARANVVKASLSAWDQPSMQTLNRPHPDLTFEGLLEGLRRFRNEFAGKLWIEVFLVEDVNTRPDQIARIADHIRTLHPDRIQLNTAVRPPCEPSVHAVAKDRIESLTRQFDPPAEVIAEYRGAHADAFRATEADILGILRRRPCTLSQICRALAVHRNAAAKHLGALFRTDQIDLYRQDEETFFVARRSRPKAIRK